MDDRSEEHYSDIDDEDECQEGLHDRHSATVRDDPYYQMPGGLMSDFPRYDELPSEEEMIPFLKRILLRKKVQARLPPPHPRA